MYTTTQNKCILYTTNIIIWIGIYHYHFLLLYLLIMTQYLRKQKPVHYGKNSSWLNFIIQKCLFQYTSCSNIFPDDMICMICMLMVKNRVVMANGRPDLDIKKQSFAWYFLHIVLHGEICGSCFSVGDFGTLQRYLNIYFFHH